MPVRTKISPKTNWIFYSGSQLENVEKRLEKGKINK